MISGTGMGVPPRWPLVLLALADTDARKVIREALERAGGVEVRDLADDLTEAPEDVSGAVAVVGAEARGTLLGVAVAAGVDVIVLTDQAAELEACKELVAAGVYGIAATVGEVLEELGARLEMEVGGPP